LNRPISRALAICLFPLLVLLCGYSCGAPLAPGYKILRESYDVRFVSGPLPELEIGLAYKLQNVGTTELAFIDARFPDPAEFGRSGLQAEIDGRAIAPSDPAAEAEGGPNILRLPLDPPWLRSQVRTLSIRYTFRSPQNSGSLITLGPREFHLASRSWFVELEPPKHLFASTPTSPPRAGFTVRVPADFMVLARGTPKGQKKQGGDVEHRFVLSKGDLAPFVVAGRYVPSPPGDRAHAAVLWTLDPLQEDPAPVLGQITEAWNTLEADFGPLDPHIVAPHIVLSPELARNISGEPSAAAVAFPGGAIINPAALALGTGDFVDLVSHALAHNWFGDQIRPSTDASIGIGEGLSEYATIVVEEARSGEAGRRQRILEYLRRYNEARAHSSETPLGIALLTDPIGPREIALAKAPLFYVALEDICGETPVRTGLARLVKLLRGRQVDYKVLRAVLEESTNRNLAQVFRIWLNDKGLPQDFLERYRLSSASRETAGGSHGF
jgi:Peptidase family M1 domain